LVAGYQASYIDAVWCSDHFHEFRSLIRLRSVLEKQAYSAIAIEDERLRVFNNARSEGNLQKRLKQLATHKSKKWHNTNILVMF